MFSCLYYDSSRLLLKARNRKYWKQFILKNLEVDALVEIRLYQSCQSVIIGLEWLKMSVPFAVLVINVNELIDKFLCMHFLHCQVMFLHCLFIGNV